MYWLNIALHLPKNSRYTIGSRIENRFLDLVELSYTAYFSPKEQKIQRVTDCILLLEDTLKFLIVVAWEGKLISHRHHEELAIKLEEVGKMLGGWKKSLAQPEKKNRNL